MYEPYPKSIFKVTYHDCLWFLSKKKLANIRKSIKVIPDSKGLRKKNMFISVFIVFAKV